jgi:hypothetical protein
MGTASSGFMVQTTPLQRWAGGPPRPDPDRKGRLDVVVPNSYRSHHDLAGFVSGVRDDDDSSPGWDRYRLPYGINHPVDAISLIEATTPHWANVSGSQVSTGDWYSLHVVFRSGDRLFHMTRATDGDWAWSDPVEILRGVAGNPALIQSTWGRYGNFEVIVPSVNRGLLHLFRNRDSEAARRSTGAAGWTQGPLFGQAAGNFDSVALVQGDYGDPGNLEVVARSGDRLWFFWRGGPPSWTWSEGFSITDRVNLPDRPRGIHSFVQARNRDFELVCPLAGRGIVHLRRRNSEPGYPWTVVGTFGQTLDVPGGGPVDPGGPYTAVSLLQSRFETPGSGFVFECHADSGQITHHFVRPTAGASQTWRTEAFQAFPH